ncbi:MAG: biopolymer transporter ExbD [Acidobacteriota bacterium]|nr:biopolymer transporter ExbD [Acidobacteriota bacterium]
MAMTSGGGGGGAMGEINVTPMIDILLVLLIIFMVIVPVTPKGLDALVPQPPKEKQKQLNNDRTIVVQIMYRPGASPAYKINDTDVSYQELLPKLTQIYANRAERVMFVRGDDDINFSYVADVIDIAHEANVDHIGIMTPKIQQGQ